MSADEIRRLVRIYSAKEKNLKCQLEKFKDAEMTPNIENISIARNDAIMTIQALLAFAAMVERCEKIRADIMARTFKHDIGWMGGNDKVIYTSIGEILQTMKGATDGTKH